MEAGMRTTRRRVLQSAAASVVAMPFVRPFVHGAHAAGKLSVGFWDHWVPGANEPLDKLCRECAANLEPVDDIMAELIKEHGPVNSGAEYLGKQDAHWVAVPTSYGSTLSPPCARIDLMKEIAGLDVTKMYPAGAPPDKELTEKWN